MKKPLLIVRHAQARHHVENLTGGWTDTELTQLGFRQAQLLADRLVETLNGRRVLIAGSDLNRAVQTAEILAQALGARLEQHPGLRDLNNGIAAGKTHEQARPHRVAPSEPLEDWRPYPTPKRGVSFPSGWGSSCRPSPGGWTSARKKPPCW